MFIRLLNTWTRDRGCDILIDRLPFVIGRQSDVDYTIDLAFISRRHARFFERDGQVWVQDLESQNGTSVNGQPIRLPRQLANGDLVAIGPLTFRVNVFQSCPQIELPGGDGQSY